MIKRGLYQTYGKITTISLRLQKLVEADLDALPDRPPPPLQNTQGDDELAGDISIATIEKSNIEAGSASKSEETTQADLQSFTAPSSKSAEVKANHESSDRRFVWGQGAVSSFKLDPSPRMSSHPPVTLRRGDPATVQYFTPIRALVKYPYVYCNRDTSQDIASGFFDAGKFWTREWELYYVWDIDTAKTKPLILVPEHQFESLLHEINSVFKFNLIITPQQREEGLVGRFPDHPRCVPRYLGRSSTREDFYSMADSVPSTSFRADDEGDPPALEGRTLADFKKLMEEMWDAQQKKNKAGREKRQQLQVAKKQALVQAFKRAQRYLGLRPTEPGALTTIDPKLPVNLPFDQSVVFVCVDVESYERAHHKITEIGIASLDTRDLAGVAPGNDGENWRTKVHARHFRIEEYKHLINRDFVHGCPDRFEFGKSEFIPLDQAAHQTEACFQPPFCAMPDRDNPDDPMKFSKVMEIDEKRNLIFLGHDTLTDANYLQTLGFDLLKLPNLLETMDSAALYRVWKREQQSTNLGRILADFDIVGWNLHNAGNDAVYTVYAMLGVCVREASIRGSAQLSEKNEGNEAIKRAHYIADAEQRAKEEADGWSETEDNGGPPQLILPNPKPTQPETSYPIRVDNRGGRTQDTTGSSTFSSPYSESGRRWDPASGRGDGVSRYDGSSDRSTRHRAYNQQDSQWRGRSYRGGDHTMRANYATRGQSHQRGSEQGRTGRSRGRGRSRSQSYRGQHRNQSNASSTHDPVNSIPEIGSADQW
ncbi:hypothetical protein B0J11DRAFT_536476 [Dendryphion nanum]|uniref:Gfd2/YDR514C-like C-terminal domain-containing protein n=1 Tax=Dendryphion nanum TaxID=256645 RepID=A0A9P9IFP4_9PLEO|nr:hypothetical protein B0J11DRAFT_536476 [Dendryphion nanum]